MFIATKSVKIFGILAIRSRNHYFNSYILIMNHKYDSSIRNNLFQSPMPQQMTSLLKAVLVSHSMSNTKWELVEQRWVLRAICWWRSHQYLVINKMSSQLHTDVKTHFQITRTGNNSNVVRLQQYLVNEKKSYSGFVGFSRKYCGKDVMAALQDGRLR